MKQIKILTALLFISGFAVVSCGPSKAEREMAAREDSIRRVDSIAAVEAARIEQARRDSIEYARRDSIAKIEEFQSKIPSFPYIFDIYNEDIQSYLTGLGFTRTKKGHINEELWREKRLLHIDCRSIPRIIAFSLKAPDMNGAGGSLQLKELLKS